MHALYIFIYIYIDCESEKRQTTQTCTNIYICTEGGTCSCITVESVGTIHGKDATAYFNGYPTKSSKIDRIDEFCASFTVNCAEL